MELKVEKITAENFNEFGSILNPFDCGEPRNLGNEIVKFYPDRMMMKFNCCSLISISPLLLKKREFKINLTENHSNCEEVFGGFTEDIVFHAGLPSVEPDISKFKVFYLPKYTLCRLKSKVWHGAPFVIDKEETQGWVILPPYTYANDCRVVALNASIKIKFN
jgi:hypothetical protein